MIPVAAAIPALPMKNSLPAIPSRREKLLKTGLLITAALLLLAGALSIPFLFESPSIKYKFGFDKTLLRIGKLLGMGAATLLLFQLLLGSRLNIIERALGRPRVYALHRLGGMLTVLLVLLHPVFILWPENFTLPPLRIEYWPQAAGLLLLVLICLQVAGALWRRALSLSNNRWRALHRYTSVLIILLLLLHP